MLRCFPRYAPFATLYLSLAPFAGSLTLFARFSLIKSLVYKNIGFGFKQVGVYTNTLLVSL